MADIKPIKLSPLGTLSNAKPGDVIPVEHGGTGVTDLGLILDSVLPDQSGNTNRVLTTNGTAASWSDINADVITTGTLSNARTSGTSANTPSALVLRDGSGNFAAGTITATSITLAANPTSALQAATKQYVDAVQQGLLTKPAVKSATTTDLGATYNNGTSGVGATLTIPATATLTISNVSTWNLNDGILVKDQTSTSQNGRYVVTQIGNASTTWILTRCSLCDQADEIPGAYMFVTDGDYTNSGFVLSVDTPDTFVVGTDAISVYLFTGAASYMPGTGINVTGNTISLQYAPASTNTASTLVLRDGSGNFSAGTITATLSGNASTSTALQTARTLTIGSTGKTFDGTGDVSWSLGEIGAQAAGNYVTTDTTQTITGAKTFSATLTATSNVRTNNGTAALPSHSFNTDSGVGMYRPDTNTLAFSTSGTEACRISDTGRLLVGTTTDDGIGKLQVDTGLSFQNSANIYSTNSTGRLALYGNTATSNGATLVLYANSEGTFPGYARLLTGNNNTAAFSSAGNTMFGTATDNGTERVQVNGNLALTAAGSVMVTGTTDTSLVYLMANRTVGGGGAVGVFGNAVSNASPIAGGVRLYSDGNAILTVVNGRVLMGTTTDDGSNMLQLTGNAAISGRCRTWIGSASNPAHSFIDDPDTGMYSPADDVLALVTGGVNRLTLGTSTATSSLLLLTPNGTAAAPSFAFSAQSNTGMYRLGTNAIGFTTNGSLALSLDGSGNGVFTGTCTATSFSGSGASLTSLNASNLTSGTVPDARLTGIYSGFSLKSNGTNTYFTSTSSGTSDVRGRTVFGLAEYRSHSGTETGAIIIRAPNATQSIMHQLDISVHTYTGVGIGKFTVQGYRSGATTFANTGKASYGGFDIQIQIGVDPSGNTCFILGTTSTAWSYPHVSVTKAMFSHSGLTDTYCTGWTVDVVTSLTGYTLTALADRPLLLTSDGSAGAPSLSFGSDTNTGIYRSASAQLTVTTGGTAAATFYANGSFTAVGDVTAYSDKRLKKDLVVIPNALDKIQQLTGYTYERIDTGVHQAGLIAQDVQAVLPEVVDASGDYLAIAYGNLAGLFVEAIKDLRAENAALKAELQCIKEQLK